MRFDMTFSFVTCVRACAVALLLAPVPGASAQTMRPQQLETRAALIDKAAREERAGRRGQAAVIRDRLLNGDFQEGDRVVVSHENPPATGRGDASLIRPDTLPVRAGRIIQFPQSRYEGVTDLPVAGLLRSELPDTLRAHFAKTYRAPVVRVTSLVALSVIGAVTRTGLIDVSPDVRLNDVLTQAGLAGDADLRKIIIRRGAQDIMTGKEVQEALNSGITVDGAQLRANDQIIVARKSPTNWLTYAGLAMSVITMTLALSRGRDN